MKIDLYTQKGEKKGQLEVSDVLFHAPINDEAVRLLLMRQQANERHAIAHTKTRGEVIGSTRKLYRQKGTGRARTGSAKNPIRRGGGVIFGPRNVRTFTKRMPKSARRVALFSLLSQKAGKADIFALENYLAPSPKTKDFAALVQKLPASKSLLVVLDQRHDVLEKSAANVPQVKTILVNYINPFDLLKYDKILFLQAALKRAEELFI